MKRLQALVSLATPESYKYLEAWLKSGGGIRGEFRHVGRLSEKLVPTERAGVTKTILEYIAGDLEIIAAERPRAGRSRDEAVKRTIVALADQVDLLTQQTPDVVTPVVAEWLETRRAAPWRLWGLLVLCVQRPIIRYPVLW